MLAHLYKEVRNAHRGTQVLTQCEKPEHTEAGRQRVKQEGGQAGKQAGRQAHGTSKQAGKHSRHTFERTL